MYIRIRFNGKIFPIPDLSKLTTIKQLRKKLAKHPDIGLTVDRQRILFKGKQLDDDYSLFDYDFRLNDLADLTEKIVVKDDDSKASCSTSNDVFKDEVKMNDSSVEDKENNSGNSDKPSDTPLSLAEVFQGDPKELGIEPECKKCKDDPTKKCAECGCAKCRGKERPEELLFCDECEYVYHLQCLDPPLDAVPDEDEWYCPDCKNDEAEIVAPGARLKLSKKKSKMPSHTNRTKRDWGNGMATAGRTKSCTKVPVGHFGPVPGVEVGMCWKFRMQVSEEGVHRPPVAGIAGTAAVGAQSLVLAGGYEDDVDNGDEFYYTGAGGRDLSGNKRTSEQAFDQKLTMTNLALARNCNAPVNEEEGADAKDKWQKGKPIRVVRSEKLAKHSKYAPVEGCRYDGVYKLVKYWTEKGQSGFYVWRYLFRRDDPTPAPWTDEGKALIAKKGYKCIFPDGHLEALAAKKAAKDAKAAESKGKGGKGKKGGKRSKSSSDDADEAETSSSATPEPASKKAKISAFFSKSESEHEPKYEVEEELKAAASADKLNEKKWDEVMAGTYRTKLEFTDAVEQMFQCLCCQDIVHMPVTSPCLHNQCKACLKRSFKAEWYSCPVCRTDLKNIELDVNKDLQQALLTIFPGYADQR